MTWTRLCLKEWRRRPWRTGITTAGVAIAIAALWSLLSFEQGYRTGVSQELDRLGAHILVTPKGCPYDAASIALHGANWPCYLDSRYLDEVRTTRGVATAAPALMLAFYDTAGEQRVYVGTDTNMLALKPGWHFQGEFPRRSGDLLVGADLAKRRHWRLGQTVELPELRPATARVAGVLAPTHGADDEFIFLGLADAQARLHRPGQLTHILVRLQDPNALDQVAGQLRGCDAGLYMNVVPLGHLFRTLQQIVRSTRLMLACIALVALLAAGAGVSNSVLMSVCERKREIGVLRALGASRRQVFGLFWLETVQVCLAGAVSGIALAYLASSGVEHWLRTELPFAPRESLIRWENWVLLLCLGAALALGSLAGFLPAWRAALLPPIRAMRSPAGLG